MGLTGTSGAKGDKGEQGIEGLAVSSKHSNFHFHRKKFLIISSVLSRTFCTKFFGFTKLI